MKQLHLRQDKPAIMRPRPRCVNRPSCTVLILAPQCIATMYNITKATKANPNNKMGIFEEGDFYAAEDLV